MPICERSKIVPYFRTGLLDLLKRLVLLLHEADCRVKHLVINAFRKTDISSVPVVAEPILSGTLAVRFHGEQNVVFLGTLIREVLEHTRDSHLVPFIFLALNHFADCFPDPAEFLCKRPRDHQAGGHGKCLFRISCENLCREDIEIGCVGENQVAGYHIPVLILEAVAFHKESRPCSIFHSRHVLPETGCYPSADLAVVDVVSLLDEARPDLIYVLRIPVAAVVAEFEADLRYEYYTDSQADTERQGFDCNVFWFHSVRF